MVIHPLLGAEICPDAMLLGNLSLVHYSGAKGREHRYPSSLNVYLGFHSLASLITKQFCIKSDFFLI